MKLTRRDAVAALVAGGAGSGAALGLIAGQRDDSIDALAESVPLPADGFRTVVAVAEVIYPSAVEGIPEFLAAYLSGVHGADRDGIADAAARLERLSTRRDETSFAERTEEDRDELLRALGVDAADSKPAGEPVERIRYHLVNELLYALFVSPTGSRLVGIENPVGHPGGYDSYREEP